MRYGSVEVPVASHRLNHFSLLDVFNFGIVGKERHLTALTKHLYRDSVNCCLLHFSLKLLVKK